MKSSLNRESYSYLFCEQHPDAGEVLSKVVGLDRWLLGRDPRLHHVRLPHELQHGAVLVQAPLPLRRQAGYLLDLLLQLLAPLVDVLVVVVPTLGQRVAGAGDPADVVRVRREVRLEGGVLLQQTLGWDSIALDSEFCQTRGTAGTPSSFIKSCSQIN